MKKKISTILAVLSLCLISYLVYYVTKTIKRKNEITAKTIHLPTFEFYKLDKSPYNQDSLQGYNNRLIIEYFSPDCEHCQYTAKQYLEAKEKLNTTRILMVTSADSLAVANFYNEYHLSEMPDILLLSDPKVQFPKYFGAGMIPCFFVYKDHHLLNRFLGETRIPNLLSDTLIKL